MVIGDEHLGVLHEFTISDDVAEGGVLDHDDELRDQCRDDVAKGLGENDGEENLGLGQSQASRCIGLAAGDGKHACAVDLSHHCGGAEADGQRQHPVGAQLDPGLRKYKKTHIDQQQRRRAAQELDHCDTWPAHEPQPRQTPQQQHQPESQCEDGGHRR